MHSEGSSCLCGWTRFRCSRLARGGPAFRRGGGGSSTAPPTAASPSTGPCAAHCHSACPESPCIAHAAFLKPGDTHVLSCIVTQHAQDLPANHAVSASLVKHICHALLHNMPKICLHNTCRLSQACRNTTAGMHCWRTCFSSLAERRQSACQALPSPAVTTHLLHRMCPQACLCVCRASWRIHVQHSLLRQLA